MVAAVRRIVRVLNVIDTRDFVEERDGFKPVPGTGSTHQCDRCGRSHEVHVIVELDDGTDANIGSTCRRADGVDADVGRAIERAVRAATRCKAARLAAAKWAELANAVDAIEREVDALPAPRVEWEPDPSGHGWVSFCGGDRVGRLFETERPTSAARERDVVETWRRQLALRRAAADGLDVHNIRWRMALASRELDRAVALVREVGR